MMNTAKTYNARDASRKPMQGRGEQDQVSDSLEMYFQILPNGNKAVGGDRRLQVEDHLVQDRNFPDVYHSGDFRKRACPQPIAHESAIS